MHQINTSAPNGNPAFNSDMDKIQLQELAQEFMNTTDVNKRVRSMIGKQTRFNVNMDDLRKFSDRLHNYVKKNPI
jgi:hypothetical protein